MSNYFYILISSILICLYIQLFWDIFLSILYFSIPWLIWCAIVIFLVLRFGVRITPLGQDRITKVLGTNPFAVKLSKNKFFFDDSEDEDMGYSIRYVAHRGAHLDYAENTITAFKKCHELGCDVVEFDVSLTKDNIPIVFHDNTLERLTGEIGNINDMTWKELKKFDVSATHPLREKLNPSGERIALLDEAFENCLKNGQKMFIDIKANCTEIVKVITEAYKKYPRLYEMAVVTGFDPVTIYMIRRKDPKIITGLNWRPRFFSYSDYSGRNGPKEPRHSNLLKQLMYFILDFIHDWAFTNVTYYVLGISFVLVHKDIISLDYVRQWYEKDVRVFAWTVNSPAEKTNFSKNLRVTYMTDSIISELNLLN